MRGDLNKSAFKIINTENNSPRFAVIVALCATTRWTRQAAMIVDCSISVLWVKEKSDFIDAPQGCKYLYEPVLMSAWYGVTRLWTIHSDSTFSDLIHFVFLRTA